MYVKSKGKNIVLSERTMGMGWPMMVMPSPPPPAAPANPLAALQTGASSSSPPSWGALAAQASGNPLAALQQPGVSSNPLAALQNRPAMPVSFGPQPAAPSGGGLWDTLLGGIKSAGQQVIQGAQNIGTQIGQSIGGGGQPAAPMAPQYAPPPSSGPGLMTYALVGGGVLAAVLLLRKKKG